MAVAAVTIALIAGPLVLYQVLPLIGVPVALASGTVAVILLKHLGILAVLLTPMDAFLVRRSGHGRWRAFCSGSAAGSPSVIGGSREGTG